MKKKILFVIDSLTSGGAEKSLISLLTTLDYSKYDVDLLMFYKKGLYIPLIPKEVNVIEVPIFLLDQSKGIKYLLKYRKIKNLYLKFMISLNVRNPYLKNKLHVAQITWKYNRKGIEKLNKAYDVAIAYSQGMPTYYVSEKVQAKKKICWINTDYNKAPYNKKFDIEHYEKFYYIVAVSEYCKKSIIKKLPTMENKIRVVYDIISSNLIKSMALKSDGFKDDYNGIRILTIGRLVHLKGYDMAIEAARKLSDEGINFRWYVIGEGNLKNELINKVGEYELQEKFIFLGTTINPYVYLKQADIYVQPSRYEGFGMAISEAKILNKIVVATNFSIVHDQLENGRNGKIVNMDGGSLYIGIKEILENKNLRDSIKVNLLQENNATDNEILKIYNLIEN